MTGLNYLIQYDQNIKYRKIQNYFNEKEIQNIQNKL